MPTQPGATKRTDWPGQAYRNIQAMGITPLTDEQLPVGKANTDGMGPFTPENKNADKKNKNKIITDISKNFAGNAPLWFYILAEAQQHAFDIASENGKQFTMIPL